MPKDQDILVQVNKLVAEEQELRTKLQHREIDEAEEHQRLLLGDKLVYLNENVLVLGHGSRLR